MTASQNTAITSRAAAPLARDIEAETGTLRDLGEVDLWQKPWFQKKLLGALRHDGLQDAELAFLSEILVSDQPADYEAFKNIAVKRIQALPTSSRAPAQKLLDHLENVTRFNRDIYYPQTPDEIIKRFWPNNPKMLATEWHAYADIFETDFFVEPNRFISNKTAIGSAGSCFAAAISRQLQYWGYNYVIEMGQKPENIDDPYAYEVDPARCGVIYSAPVMRQMVERAFGEWVPEKIVLNSVPKFIDPFRGKPDYSDIEGYHRDYAEHNAALKRALTRCDVFIVTLGMTEAWYFADSNRFTSTTPRGKEHSLFRHKNLTVADNVAELERLHEVYTRHHPNIKLIVTVSPVPINSTFNLDRHVVVANSLSKSTLRVAAEEFCRRHPDNCFYFPSYEIVLYGSKDPWEIDRRHIATTAVARVMQQFQRMFMIDQAPMPILGETNLADLFPEKRNYALYWARRVVRPVKRQLGIEGRSFREAFKSWCRKKLDQLHPPLK